jgi:hypothetical protein
VFFVPFVVRNIQEMATSGTIDRMSDIELKPGSLDRMVRAVEKPGNDCYVQAPVYRQI